MSLGALVTCFDPGVVQFRKADHCEIHVSGGEFNVAPTLDLDVLDRVGGGEGFAAGLFYGLLTGEAPEAARRLGRAHGALVALSQARALAAGGSARIGR